MPPAEKKCAHCVSEKIQLKHVARSFGKCAELMAFESIPVWSCQACGEPYFWTRTSSPTQTDEAGCQHLEKSHKLQLSTEGFDVFEQGADVYVFTML
jgi:hypothetical protein